MTSFSIRLVLGVVVFALATSSAIAQDSIRLKNPSFEDTPRAGGLGFSIPIKGWHDCARAVYPDQTPPDIHPHPEAWMVSVNARDGNTFLGMVVRENESHEFISQAMEVSLKEGKCYSFSISLAQSEMYMGVRNSASSETRDGKPSMDSLVFSDPFMKPAVLRIWGGNSICSKGELLGVSPPVTNRDWAQYQFKFEPSTSSRYITLEAFYVTPVLSAYNGHILVDAASAIVSLSCDEEVPPFVAEEPVEVVGIVAVLAKPKADPPPKPEKEDSLPQKIDEEPAERILTDLDRENIQTGQTIRVTNLYFQADSFRIEPESYPVLDEIVHFLRKNPDVIIEIGGHTSTGPPHDFCDQLSEARAKAVTDYLIKKGVNIKQLKYKGYGKRYPIVKNDRKEYDSARKKNQRVEIKVLSVDGD